VPKTPRSRPGANPSLAGCSSSVPCCALVFSDPDAYSGHRCRLLSTRRANLVPISFLRATRGFCLPAAAGAPAKTWQKRTLCLRCRATRLSCRQLGAVVDHLSHCLGARAIDVHLSSTAVTQLTGVKWCWPLSSLAGLMSLPSPVVSLCVRALTLRVIDGRELLVLRANDCMELDDIRVHRVSSPCATAGRAPVLPRVERI
jgi:hypothetical protein